MEKSRDKLRKLLRDKGLSLSGASRQLGRNSSYLQQYLERGSPRELPASVEKKLAGILKVPQSELGDNTAALEEELILPEDDYSAALMVIEYALAHSERDLSPSEKVKKVQKMRDLIADVRGR